MLQVPLQYQASIMKSYYLNSISKTNRYKAIRSIHERIFFILMS